MVIKIKHSDGKYDMVNDLGLELLIEARAIHSFLRSDGWAVVGVDPTRKAEGEQELPEHERRSRALH